MKCEHCNQDLQYVGKFGKKNEVNQCSSCECVYLNNTHAKDGRKWHMTQEEKEKLRVAAEKYPNGEDLFG